jgi:hypothetical protein
VEEHNQMITQSQRPLPIGTRLIYYNKERCREMGAIVKDAGYVILWIIDQEHSENDEHFIGYKDIVRAIEVSDLH